jgi:hypothetical protein
LHRRQHWELPDVMQQNRRANLTLRLIENGSTWLIETDTRVDVPLEFFFQ